MKTNSDANPANPSEAAIFDAALTCTTPQERTAYLDKACAGQPELRQRVESLLAAHEEASKFLEPKPDAARPTIRLALPEEQVGERIGRYKLLQKIGEGGCGVVYMAEQEEPVRRRVALKVIKLGMDTKQVVARFEAERQALALMDHPNIAKVLDAGATDAGRPFFVMELVKGIPATRYADENKLDTRQRLDLFIQICQAVQHAHQKGIIHRDLKPSNVLVADHDGIPVPKVIDFGIAKATTDQRLTDKTLFTALEQFIGTPAYMSPEQAKLSGLDVDTRSDIYSLGVLLYELLTGKTPFDARRLLDAGFDEIRRIIREEEPVKPSTRLTQEANSKSEIKSALRTLHSAIPSDLDWIVMKCLEKDRTRRYETANGLAADVQRHLSNEPVVACPPSAGYRFQKMVRRNKAAFAITTTVVGLVVIGLSVSLWLMHGQKAALKRALAAETAQKLARAESEAHELMRQVNEYWVYYPQGQDDVTVYDPVLAACRKSLALRREVHGSNHIDVALSLEGLSSLLEDAPPSRKDESGAEAARRESFSIKRRVLSRTDTALADAIESQIYYESNALEKIALSRELVELRTKLQPEQPWLAFRATTELAHLLKIEKQSNEAMMLYRRLMDSYQPPVRISMRTDYRFGYLGDIKVNLANLLLGQGRTNEAESIYREVDAVMNSADFDNSFLYGTNYYFYGIGGYGAKEAFLKAIADFYEKIGKLEDKARCLAAAQQAAEMDGDSMRERALAAEKAQKRSVQEKELAETMNQILTLWPTFDTGMGISHDNLDLLVETESLLRKIVEMSRQLNALTNATYLDALQKLTALLRERDYRSEVRDEVARLYRETYKVGEVLHGKEYTNATADLAWLAEYLKPSFVEKSLAAEAISNFASARIPPAKYSAIQLALLNAKTERPEEYRRLLEGGVFPNAFSRLNVYDNVEWVWLKKSDPIIQAAWTAFLMPTAETNHAAASAVVDQLYMAIEDHGGYLGIKWADGRQNDPRYASRIFALKSRVELQRGNLSDALALAERAVGYDESSIGFCNLALAQFRNGDKSKARFSLEKAAKLNLHPKSWEDEILAEMFLNEVRSLIEGQPKNSESRK